jgi:hypothetical protein
MDLLPCESLKIVTEQVREDLLNITKLIHRYETSCLSLS